MSLGVVPMKIIFTDSSWSTDSSIDPMAALKVYHFHHTISVDFVSNVGSLIEQNAVLKL